jgi:hypothetical protein
VAEINDVASFARKLLRDASPNKLRGGQLSVLLKTNFPDLNLLASGFRNLRDFIAKNVPEVIEVGRAGTDIVYGLREEQQSLFPESREAGGEQAPGQVSLVQQLLDNPKVWRTFASPESPYRLYLVPPGRLRVLRPADTPEPTWFRVQPISGETLLQIGKDFVSELSEPQRAPLAKCLTETKWWMPFFDAVRDLGLKTRWIIYRRRRIVAEFQRALMDAPPVVIHQEAPHLVEKLHAAEQPPAPSQTGMLARRVALAAVGRMTEAELRALSLPLGYVMDALSQ